MPVTHIVLIRWSNESSEATQEEVAQRVRDLGDRIDGIRSVVEGPSNSPEGLERGYDYGFVITFDDVAARDAYLPHPEHSPVAALIGTAAEEVLVFDL